MLLRFTSRCLVLCLSAVAGLAGCSEHQARFADATPAQLERVYSASSGGDLISAVIIGINFSDGNDTTSCPTVVTEGQDTTISGGCSAPDGARVDGSIAIHNRPEFGPDKAYDPSQPTSVEFDFHVTSPEHESLALDGRVEFDKSGISGDLTTDHNAISSTSRLALTCGSHGACTASPGSEIEISDLGSASVEGTWSLDFPSSGRVTVRGADVLVFDIASRDEDGCVPYTIADKSGTVCFLATGEDARQARASNRLQRWSWPLLEVMQ